MQNVLRHDASCIKIELSFFKPLRLYIQNPFNILDKMSSYKIMLLHRCLPRPPTKASIGTIPQPTQIMISSTKNDFFIFLCIILSF